MAYSDKVWKDSPDHTTPLSAAGLNDWEARILAGINNAIKAGAATLTYNSDGTLASASTPAVTVDTITYDTQGRISTFRETIDTGVHVTRTLTYDATGNLTAES